jgi:hypothetical protein
VSEVKAGRAFDLGIWGFAAGYFLCYVPYASMTKAITSRTPMLPGIDEPIAGLSLLPISVGASMVGMLGFITLMGWWQYAGRGRIAGREVPMPNRWTLLSGVCTAGVIGTTTLAYTFKGVSIVFMMLLMRGGLLIIAPVVDLFSKRHVRWFSWVAVLLSLGALFTAFAEDLVWIDGQPSLEHGFALPLLAVIDVGIYLAAYFVRLRFMSRLAKSDDINARTRYFVEEQMVASPTLFVLLCVMAIIGSGDSGEAIRAGFTDMSALSIVYIAVIGVMSQGTGIFGGLILLDRRENTFCVPVNRSSSILAGIVATFGLYLLSSGRRPSTHELIGAALIITAILFLTLAPLRARARASAKAKTA